MVFNRMLLLLVPGAPVPPRGMFVFKVELGKRPLLGPFRSSWMPAPGAALLRLLPRAGDRGSSGTQLWVMPRCFLMGNGILLMLGCYLLLGLLLPCADCSPQPTWGSAAYEIVIPRKLGPKAGKASRDSMSYVISIQRVNYTIHLRQKTNFIIKNLPIFTRDSQGKIMIEQPRVLADCYYHGYVEGIPDSMVTLTTCSGLRGLLQIGNLSYSIEPLAASSASEHLLLQREVAVPGTVIYKTPQRGRQFPGHGTAKGQLKDGGHMRYLELLVVVDKEGFDAFGGDITNVMLEVIEIINLVDGLFSSFRLRVLLAVLEIWTEKNPISITKNISEVLHNFNLWQIQQSPTHVAHDVGCLFASLDFGHSTGALYRSGKSNFASACDRKRASAVVSFAKRTYMDTAVYVAHELGYVLGIDRDDKYCRCGNASKCIMNAQSTVSYEFSNCSTRYFFDFIASGRGNCLNNIPESVTMFVPQRCGNGILELGEECDCGSEAQCELDPCCDNSCRKKEGAICTSGLCCKNCKPLPEGKVCRESTNPCDLPEYCNGISEHCPADVTKQDGTVCAEDGYCYAGKCKSRMLQCRNIFGEKAEPAPLKCYRKLNMKGDRFGNCQGDGLGTKFQKCKPENVLCGRVQCINVWHLPWLEEHSTIIQTPVDDTLCWGTDYHLGMETLDTGAIEDGTQCGVKKICINQTCMLREKHLAPSCSAQSTCRGRGVCNNKGNCHCNRGWAPPNCQFFGFGGSIDSGPTPVTKNGLMNFIIKMTMLTVTGVVLTALVMDRVRKLRARRALSRVVGCFQARERAPEGV
ncbi:disintegrin and metalloproteinase domain-containing protein 20-like [Anas acuta]|uniref:disintegrin and metalloproteinase domain-containing protein 20-like n=1 Tax=Anas acuta TaxID=28680 RepID=UPI0035C88DBC